MSNRVIVRIKSNLSFAGELCKNDLIDDRAGVLIKTNPESGIRVWCPKEEIDCIIMSKDRVIKGDELENEFGL